MVAEEQDDDGKDASTVASLPSMLKMSLFRQFSSRRDATGAVHGT
jgi:hypothetical protein